MWVDRKIQKKEFSPGDKVLRFNSSLKSFRGKLKSKWEGPYQVEEVFKSWAIKLKGNKDTWIVNRQRHKPYLASEVKTVEVIDTITPEELISRRYGVGA